MSSVKRNKITLPKDWIVVKSTSFPDRTYYFNVRSGESSWKQPNNEKDNVKMENLSKKQKLSKDTDEGLVARSPTPDGAVPIEPSKRQVLKAKRRLNAEQSLGTPQMKAMRAKILESKSKAGPSMRPISDKKTNRSVDRDVIPDQLSSARSEPAVTVVETPEMTELRDKMLEKKLKSGSHKFKSDGKLSKRLVLKVDSAKIGNTVSLISQGHHAQSMVNKLLSVPEVSIKTLKSSALKSSSMVGSTKPATSSNSITRSIPKENNNLTGSKIEIRGNRRSCLNTTVSTTPNSSKFEENSETRTISTAPMKKNIAQKRLKIFQRKLSIEREINPVLESAAPTLRKVAKATGKQDETIFQKKVFKLHDSTENNNGSRRDNISETPNVYTDSEARHLRLRDRLTGSLGSPRSRAKKSIEISAKAAKLTKSVQKIKKTVETKIASNEKVNAMLGSGGTCHDVSENNCDEFYESMDWEPIPEEKILNEIQEVRMKLFCDHNTRGPCLVNHNKQGLEHLKNSGSKDEQIRYIIVDTNVFLSNIKMIGQLIEEKSESHCKPVLVIPWTVMQELDYIKDNKSKTKSAQLQWSARKAVNLLYEYFSSGNQRIKGQTAAEAVANRTKFEVECPDDEILQSCLQIRELQCSVVLLSNDKNLCNKAMIHGISTFSHNDEVKKILSLKKNADETVKKKRLQPQQIIENFPTFSNPDNEDNAELADEIFGEAKAIIKHFLSEIVAKELENLYGENWKKYAKVPPPWSAMDALQCASNHWIAVISDHFIRAAETVIHQLLGIFRNGESYCRNLVDVNGVLMKCQDLSQMVKSNSYAKLAEKTFYDLKKLIEKCQDTISNQSRDSFPVSPESDIQKSYDRQRIVDTFSYFEEIWSFTNSFCGTAADMLGIPHSIDYKKLNHTPSIDTMTHMQPALASNLNQLIDALRSALDKPENLTPTHPLLLNLHQIISNYLPNREYLSDSRSLDPADLLRCVIAKKELLRTGLVQLQELSFQFCRIAEFHAA